MIITQQFNTNATKNLARAAYRYLGKDTSFSDLRTKVAKLSYLYLHELGASSRVAFVARNSPAYLASFLALSNCRSVTIPIDPDKPPEEVLKILKDTKATHIAVTNDMISRVREMLHSVGMNLPLVEIEKKQGGEYSNSFTPPPENPPSDNDPILIMRTAGTLGTIKYVAFNHKQLIHAATSLRLNYKLTSNDRFYTHMSWAHPFAFFHGMLFPLLIGATTVIDHGAEGNDLLDFFVESRVTRIIGLPSFFLKILLICRDEKRRIAAGVKSVTVGLGKLDPAVQKAIGLMQIAVANCYGLAEACWTIAMEAVQKEEEAPLRRGGKKVVEEPVIPDTSSGIPVGKGIVGLKYKVIDDNGDEIPGKDKREGLLCVTGPSIMTKYYENEKESKTTIRGTWLYTNEFARLEGEGETLNITFLARRPDGLRSGNEILTAEAIDKALKGAPGVTDAAGFLLKDSRNETRFACSVVKTPGTALNEKQVLEICGSKLPANQVPVIATFSDFIPRDAGGNVIRSKLSAQFSGALG